MPYCFFVPVVFMGSEKFPDENSFDTFIKQHGGSDNASTDTERVSLWLGIQLENSRLLRGR